MQDGTEKEMNKTTASIVLFSLLFGVALCGAIILFMLLKPVWS